MMILVFDLDVLKKSAYQNAVLMKRYPRKALFIPGMQKKVFGIKRSSIR